MNYRRVMNKVVLRTRVTTGCSPASENVPLLPKVRASSSTALCDSAELMIYIGGLVGESSKLTHGHIANVRGISSHVSKYLISLHLLKKINKTTNGTRQRNNPTPDHIWWCQRCGGE